MTVGGFNLTPIVAILWLAIGLPLAIEGFRTRKDKFGYGPIRNILICIPEFFGGPITLSHKYS
ncbi:MAG: hypothetical protein UV40_C0024G0010 [Parcubacteria group bacterium GW2011_GWA1_42_7]|nr:MAG: hypothetical protein UV34_C0025G0011 [Parcubacteria group bacterium GW2011_GWB1_42_6]KKS69408.1 MAG: hypothetical protein UV40_C0024G0010 [Parcubacteria group bacterium GW2011_GWA1_42_7]KKS91987.1 MAG: hypothetical protein UV67_C0013G0012 [Parcubacteria group bacterium GW2011_GWC1_43_12]